MCYFQNGEIYGGSLRDHGAPRGGGHISLTNDIHRLICFNPKEDPTNLAAKWKRSFNLFLTAKGVTNDKQKVALLLHKGGFDL